MAPKSTSKPASKAESMAPPSTASRKSARIAGSAAPESAAEPKKRPAPESKTGTEKKAKPASDKAPTSKSTPKVASKKAPASKANDKTASKKKEDAIEEEKAEEEKEAEAPADAEPTTDSKGPLKKGDKLPKITIEDNEGNAVDVSTLGNEGEKGIVLFLYPKADTPGCTTQACAYRDSNDEIAELGYTVYGLSKDKPAAQQKWITKKELNFKLLCDPESKLIKKLGAFVQPNNTKRSHFIFEKGTGKLVDIALGAPTKDDSANVIKFIKKHHE